jgi:type IV fimbrial biogenesis protein FimT
VAIPSLSQIRPRYEARAEARELVINLKKAKLEAVKRNRNVVVLFTPGVGNAGGYQIFVDINADFDYDPADNDVPLTDWRLRRNVRLATALDNTGYNSRGMLIGANGAVEVSSIATNGDVPHRISVSQSGSVRVERK